MRTLERISYIIFCGTLSFVLAGALFAVLQPVLRYDAFELSGLTLYYLINIAFALLGGMTLGAFGHDLFLEGRQRPGRTTAIIALLSGPVLSVLLKIAFVLAPAETQRPALVHEPMTLAQHVEYLIRLAAWRPPPHGRFWLLAGVLSATFLFIAWLQPMLVQRTCTILDRPAEEPDEPSAP